MCARCCGNFGHEFDHRRLFYTESWPCACANAGREADKSDMVWIGMEQQRQQALTALIYRSCTAAQYIEIILSEL